MKRTRPISKSGWPQSATFRGIARAAITKHNRRVQRSPKCGAKRKANGKPCQQKPMSNGRCYMHGGKTGSGDDWHVIQWPSDERKLAKKLAELDRRQLKRAARLAKMTPERLAKYHAWHATHKAGSAAGRARARVMAKQDRDAKRTLDRSAISRKPSPEAERLAEQIAALEALRKTTVQATEGVFG